MNEYHLENKSLSHDQIHLVDTDSPTIFDVGANVGQTKKRYRHLFPRGRIFCFEPHSESYELLSIQCSGDMMAFAYRSAVADFVGRTWLHIHHHSKSNSLLQLTEFGIGVYSGKFVSRETVPVTTLDWFCEKHEIEHIDILKLDIQGSELAALRGATKLLQREAVSLVLVEAAFIRHYRDAALFCDLASHLNEFGFALYDLYDPEHSDSGFIRHVDVIFISTRAAMRVPPSNRRP